MILSGCLLALSVLFARPGPDGCWGTRLLIHDAVLALLLLAGVATGPVPVRWERAGLAVLVAAEGLLLWRVLDRRDDAGRDDPERDGDGGGWWVVWLAAGAAVAAVAMFAGDRAAGVAGGITAAALAGTAAGRSTAGRLAPLLPGTGGLLLGSCLLPGAGWEGVLPVVAARFLLAAMLVREARAPRGEPGS
ncbi:MAG: hypothetical protein INR65_05685 [Gluconacetobacter diazotrophicus]|nr:hypothetical protein [Gluconacetobacter diazotrophicus]